MYLGLVNQRQTTRGSHKELYNNEKQPCARTQTVLPKRGPRANAPLHTSSHGKHWEGEQGEHSKHLDRNEQQEGKAKISSCQSSKRGGFHSIWVPRCAWTWEIPSTAPWSCVMLEVHPSLTPGHPWQNSFAHGRAKSWWLRRGSSSRYTAARQQPSQTNTTPCKRQRVLKCITFHFLQPSICGFKFVRFQSGAAFF